MAQLLRVSATTTARTRADIQASAEPAATLARRYGANRKTVLEWRRRAGVAGAPMGPRERRSTVPSEVEEAAVVAFRVQTRLALDDVVAALRPSIPTLTRSSAHRALQRQGVSRLPRATRPRRGEFANYEIGYFHVDFAELRTAREKAYLFVAVDRTSKVAFARVYRRATSLVAAAFLKVLARAVPYRIHTVLTDNGIQFGDAGGRRVYDRGHHPFGRGLRPPVPRLRHRAPVHEAVPPAAAARTSSAAHATAAALSALAASAATSPSPAGTPAGTAELARPATRGSGMTASCTSASSSTSTCPAGGRTAARAGDAEQESGSEQAYGDAGPHERGDGDRTSGT